MNSLVNGPAGGEQASQESISGAEVYAGQSSSPLSFGQVKSGAQVKLGPNEEDGASENDLEQTSGHGVTSSHLAASVPVAELSQF